MKIHYNNRITEKMIDNVIAIQVIGSNEPIIAILANGEELTISLDHIEMIINDNLKKEYIQ
ncbi:MAG: hypothetical protein J1F23_08800 [Oscillospiraceae bacterium]|nr:hypothetical protein [Oscillospiraceae bacterium]